MTLFYYFETLLVKLLLCILVRRKVYGQENIPRDGPLIVVANHLNIADPPLLSACIRRRIVFMAKEESFHHPIQGPLVRGFRAFPVRRGQIDRNALRWALLTLSNGLALGMFPEGTRSRDSRMQMGRSGTALIALRSAAPILPVGITGTEKIKGLFFIFGRVPITVNIGKPFFLPLVDSRKTKAELAKATGLIMGSIAGLLPEEYRGVYGGREGC